MTKDLTPSAAIMRIAILSICIFVAAIGFAGSRNSLASQRAQSGRVTPDILSGTWSLQIGNLRHKVITTMAVRFTDDQAESCMGGKWKRVLVESHSTSDERFFPVTEPLSYEMADGMVVIGRNEICDAYLHLRGELRNSKASGEYFSFGFSGGRRLGYFSLTRSTR